jgi:hypothetical protein
MSRAMSFQRASSAGASTSAASEILFKTDRPRSIDRFIDYFGGDTQAEAVYDMEQYRSSAAG